MTFQNPPPPPPNPPDEDVGAGVVAGRGADVAVAKVVRGTYGTTGTGAATAVGVYWAVLDLTSAAGSKSAIAAANGAGDATSAFERLAMMAARAGGKVAGP